MPLRPPDRVNLAITLLLALHLGAGLAHTEATSTPRQLIDRLGVDMRQALETRGKKPEDVERGVAEQISALARRSPGDDSLFDTDEQGRTPLMLAVSGGYLRVVQSLLADPIVRARIDTRNQAGETAWMVANFAPAMTLVACQPGALTLERYPLLPPYLRRMSELMKDSSAAVTGIVKALEAAGATKDPGGAKQAWLARCPHATPQTRERISRSDLLSTLIDEAIGRQMAFNKAHREGLSSLPQRPAIGMTFIAAHAAQVRTAKDVACEQRQPPVLRGAIGWSGSILLNARISTRAGVVEAVDFKVLSPDSPDAIVVDYFQTALVRALADYQCEGDHVFEQEFNFKVE